MQTSSSMAGACMLGVAACGLPPSSSIAHACLHAGMQVAPLRCTRSCVAPWASLRSERCVQRITSRCWRFAAVSLRMAGALGQHAVCGSAVKGHAAWGHIACSHERLAAQSLRKSSRDGATLYRGPVSCARADACVVQH
eukprot:93307-Chlamydomonas_euryale.AAC.9